MDVGKLLFAQANVILKGLMQTTYVFAVFVAPIPHPVKHVLLPPDKLNAKKEELLVKKYGSKIPRVR